MKTKQIAQTCLDAMQLREESWSEVEKRYTKSEMTCCKEACGKNEIDEDLAELMYLANSWPNDVYEWAQEVLLKK